MQMTFGYSDSEDRIWLSSSDGSKFWLTRRLVGRFLAPAAEVLEKTVPGGEIPNALPPGSRVALEHEESLADSPDGSPAMARDLETRSSDDPSKPPALVTTLSISADSTSCQLTLVAAGRNANITLNRLDFHRLLGALARVTDNANWRLEQPEWLAPRHG